MRARSVYRPCTAQECRGRGLIVRTSANVMRKCFPSVDGSAHWPLTPSWGGGVKTWSCHTHQPLPHTMRRAAAMNGNCNAPPCGQAHRTTTGTSKARLFVPNRPPPPPVSLCRLPKPMRTWRIPSARSDQRPCVYRSNPLRGVALGSPGGGLPLVCTLCAGAVVVRCAWPHGGALQFPFIAAARRIVCGSG